MLEYTKKVVLLSKFVIVNGLSSLFSSNVLFGNTNLCPIPEVYTLSASSLSLSYLSSATAYPFNTPTSGLAISPLWINCIGSPNT